MLADGCHVHVVLEENRHTQFFFELARQMDVFPSRQVVGKSHHSALRIHRAGNANGDCPKPSAGLCGQTAHALDDLRNQLLWAILGPDTFVEILKDLSSEIRQGEMEVAGPQVDPYYLAEGGVDSYLRASMGEKQRPIPDHWTELP